MALIDGVERGVELVVGLLRGEPLGERPGEARDHAPVAGQAIVGLVAGVAAGEGDDTQHLRMRDEVGVEPVLVRAA